MPAQRNRRHLVVPAPPAAEAYRPHGRAITSRDFARPTDRPAHAQALQASLQQVQREIAERRDELDATIHGAKPGIYVQFESPAGVDLKLESLENRRQGIELLTAQHFQAGPDTAPTQLATVFIPEGKVKHFVSRFEQYATATTKKGEPRHKEMVDRIAALRRATLRALWTDDVGVYPGEDEVIWWEVWLRRYDGHELGRLYEFADIAELTVGERRLAFEDRMVVLVRGTARQLSTSLDVLNDLAELRRAKESPTFFVDAGIEEQAAWVDELKQRTTVAPADAPAVCILDTGVTRAHPLLEDVIAVDDATAVDPGWGPHDDGREGYSGHGTEMAGLAAYGDLLAIFTSTAPVHLRHRLESVKIFPPDDPNRPELYGAVTAQAVARPEVTAPRRPRIFSLAVTAPDQRDRGQPTSWSAALDAMAAGRTFDPATQGLRYLDDADEGSRRLFVVCAGNVRALQCDYLDRCDTEPVHDPAQAWNVLTVGACTEKAVLTGPDWDAWQPLALPGELSPWSTTSVAFQETWPIKPDVVFEGGNVVHNGADVDFPAPDLCLLSTYHKPNERLLVPTYATSAATAQVARMAAIVRAEYPDFWPETVRALIVHSAQWTRAMEARLDGASGRRAKARLVRRYGFGVPSLDRALRSANDALTLIAQAVIHPFREGKMGDMHLHVLPWPRDVLQQLGGALVRLRVTLSYFIEPNPGHRGWKRRHRYASHGLRFEVKSRTETIDEFRKRLNERALDEDEETPSSGDNSTGWAVGEQARNRGSLHSDIWVGTAADLAERGIIGVYPVSGWWKDQPKRDRSRLGARYALIIGIETDVEGVDIWTPVAHEVGVPVEQVVVET